MPRRRAKLRNLHRRHVCVEKGQQQLVRVNERGHARGWQAPSALQQRRPPKRRIKGVGTKGKEFGQRQLVAKHVVGPKLLVGLVALHAGTS